MNSQTGFQIFSGFSIFRFHVSRRRQSAPEGSTIIFAEVPYHLQDDPVARSKCRPRKWCVVLIDPEDRRVMDEKKRRRQSFDYDYYHFLIAGWHWEYSFGVNAGRQ
jgi:hypothetical protein